MCSNYNYQNSWGTISRIIKFSKTVSPYTVFEVDKMPQHEIVKILNFSNLFQHYLPFYYKNTLNLSVLIIVKSQISITLYFNTLCACTSSAWGKFFKILHNIHIEAVTWHLDVFCNILVWKMSNWVCCDCSKPIWVWYHQKQVSCFLPKRCNTTKEFSIAFYVKLKKIELSYRIHLKFNLSDTHISWKGYLIGSLTPKINIHLMAYKKKQTVWRCLPSKILLSLSI